MRTTEVSHNGEISIHSDERKKLVTASVAGNNNIQETNYELYNSEEGEKVFYILIGSYYYLLDEHSIYKIWIEDHFDAGLNTDAGDYFDTASEIKPGKYENNWVCYSDSDMYVIGLEKGDELSVKVIPDRSPRWYLLTIHNEDREKLVEKWNKAADDSIVKGSIQNEEDDQDVYVSVGHGGYDSNNPKGKYILKINVKKSRSHKRRGIILRQFFWLTRGYMILLHMICG